MSSEPLLPTHSRGATPGPDALSAQRATLASQNASLDALSVGVSSVKAIAGQLHTHTHEQNVELDGLTDDMERANSRAGRAVDRTADAVRQGEAYTLRTFCMLLWPLVLLIVLLVEAVIHFIF